jgi:hypothetical protein
LIIRHASGAEGNSSQNGDWRSADAIFIIVPQEEEKQAVE